VEAREFAELKTQWRGALNKVVTSIDGVEKNRAELDRQKELIRSALTQGRLDVLDRERALLLLNRSGNPAYNDGDQLAAALRDRQDIFLRRADRGAVGLSYLADTPRFVTASPVTTAYYGPPSAYSPVVPLTWNGQYSAPLVAWPVVSANGTTSARSPSADSSEVTVIAPPRNPSSYATTAALLPAYQSRAYVVSTPYWQAPGTDSPGTVLPGTESSFGYGPFPYYGYGYGPAQQGRVLQVNAPAGATTVIDFARGGAATPPGVLVAQQRTTEATEWRGVPDWRAEQQRRAVAAQWQRVYDPHQIPRPANTS
jgi:hypothetical protein